MPGKMPSYWFPRVHQTNHAGRVQNPDDLTTGAANGYVSGQIFYDAFYVSTPSTLTLPGQHATKAVPPLCPSLVGTVQLYTVEVYLVFAWSQLPRG